MTRKEYKKLISRFNNIVHSMPNAKISYWACLHINKRTIDYDPYHTMRNHVFIRKDYDKLKQSKLFEKFNLTNFDGIEPKDLKEFNLTINGQNINW